MRRRRRSLSPRMRRLTRYYGRGGDWPIAVMTQWMRLADPEFREVFIAGLTRQSPGTTPATPPTT